MSKQIIECVPNFSEGNDMNLIKQITNEIEMVEGVKLLDVDPGKATNRTVVTFAGNPDVVVEAAFRAIKKSSEIIDMRKHKGEHPRFGATDVCPLVPVSNITMEETAEYARKLGVRVGKELGLSGYYYEYAATSPNRKNLASVRSGEYEGLPKKLKDPEWKPDFGPSTFNEKFGCVAISARDFLVAYNVNLNTKSTRRANSVAFDVREQGRVLKEGDAAKGGPVKDNKGSPLRIPGSLKNVKAIGWYIKEYGIAQISMNLTNTNITPVHIAFDEVCKKASVRGLRVTGSELVGLIPLKSMLDAGKYFLKKQNRSAGVSQDELIQIAIKSMGLDELNEFNPEKKIIEFILQDKKGSNLIDMKLDEFANETASESPAPGGGSIAAYIGSLGISLGTMVANLSAHKKGWDHRWEEFSNWAEKGQTIKDELLKLVDEDTAAFNKIMDSFGLPKNTDEEKKLRTEAIHSATKYAIEIPYRVMQHSLESFEIIKAMALTGNPNSVSDAGVGAICARSAVIGAYLNVQINSAGLKDKKFLDKILLNASEIALKAQKLESEILEIVSEKIVEMA